MAAFKAIIDALTRGSLLDEAFEDIEEMNLQGKRMFGEAFSCLMEDKSRVAERICGEDKLMNRLEVQVRTKVLKYLALNTAPDISDSLYLTSVVIDYERIGDYSKNLAQLRLLYPVVLPDDEYRRGAEAIAKHILEMFDLTREAVKARDAELAKTVLGMHEERTKPWHADLARRINEDKMLDARRAVVYALMGNNLRRISAHLRDVATGIVQPLPQLGHNPFKDEHAACIAELSPAPEASAAKGGARKKGKR